MILGINSLHPPKIQPRIHKTINERTWKDIISLTAFLRLHLTVLMFPSQCVTVSDFVTFKKVAYLTQRQCNN